MRELASIGLIILEHPNFSWGFFNFGLRRSARPLPRCYSFRLASRGKRDIKTKRDLLLPRRPKLRNPQLKSWGCCSILQSLSRSGYARKSDAPYTAGFLKPAKYCDRFRSLKGTQTMLKRTTALLLLSLSFIGCSRTAENSSQSNKNAAAPNAETPGQAKGTDGNTPLLTAVNKGDTIEVRRLVEAGADVNAANESGVTPLMNAAGM